MTRPIEQSQPRRPIPVPRIVVEHVAGRTWRARTEGRGAGAAWGIALAALDYRAAGVTDACPPTFYLDEYDVKLLRRECAALGVRVEVEPTVDAR